ncbi:MAG: FAD-binding oxidoreductase [Flavobacteriales bacterium]
MKTALIVGSGLAGISVFCRLRSRGIKATIISYRSLGSSSSIATGMYNPIVFRRVAKSWMIDDLLPVLHEFYSELETTFGIYINQSIKFKRRIPNSDYEGMWNKHALKSDFQSFIDQAENGFGNVKRAGIIDCHKLVSTFEKHASENGFLLNESFGYNHLELGEIISYKGKTYDTVFFCEGPHAVENPYFNWLPFNVCKGEWIIIKTEKELDSAVINNVVNIIPLGERRYKLSSTCSWKELDWNSTSEAEKELCSAFKEVYDCNYEIVDRAAGLRPTVADRRPYLGEHPEHRGLYIFNGLGSKGVMLAPYFSQHLVDHMLDGKPLIPEVDIQRHAKRYWNRANDQSHD